MEMLNNHLDKDNNEFNGQNRDLVREILTWI